MKVMLTVIYMKVVTKILIKLQCREGERHDRTVKNFSDRDRKYKKQKFNKSWFVNLADNNNILFLLSRLCAI